MAQEISAATAARRPWHADVRLEMVADVSFSEWSGEGRVRHPVFVGLREDKAPADVVARGARPGPAAQADAEAAGDKLTLPLPQ